MSSTVAKAALRLGLVSALGLAACAPTTPAPTALPAATQAPEVSVINFVTDSDTNISDWIQNKVAPAFEAKYPQYDVQVTIVRGVGGGSGDVADRALAALQSNADPQVDVIEFDATSKPELIEAGLWQKLDSTTVPNASTLLSGIQTSEYSLPYRGSQVVLAYDSSKISEDEVPHTFAELVEWIKTNPGQFVYCRPDKGGSGGNFVTRAIYEVTGQDPSLFEKGTPNPDLVSQFPKAWDLLSEIHPAIFDNGAYPAGNTAVLTLLANGSVSMATAWSDQALQGLANGSLPPNIKLTQLTDLPFPGGNARLSVPRNSRNLQGALDFVNYLMSTDGQVSVVKDIGGFPAANWNTLPQELQQEYTTVIAETVPLWPGGDWDALKNQGWYENVATNIPMGS